MVKCFLYEIRREGEDKILYANMETCSFAPSLEDNATCMSLIIEAMLENAGITKIILYQKREYEYDYFQTQILTELAELLRRLQRDETLSYHSIVGSRGCDRYTRFGYSRMQYLLFTLMKTDPLTAYVELLRLQRSEKIKEDTIVEEKGVTCFKTLISFVRYVTDQLSKIRLITLATPYLAGHKPNDRSTYRRLFSATIKPDFMFAKLMASYPTEGEVLDSYNFNNSEVTIFGFKDKVKTLYHIVPPEFRFTEDKYNILDSARKIMTEHKPTQSEFTNPERMREVFFNIGKDLVEDLVKSRGLKYDQKEIKELAQVLLRYTIGFGLIEVILQDPKTQDVSINSPLGSIPAFIVHQDYDDCDTNIIVTTAEAESWATKLRLISGRPLDEANPILDTELKIPGMTSRVAAVTSPLNPSGLNFSFRRHRDRPWTLPLFMHAKMINEICAGLLSFIVDGTRTMLIGGTRSSGKTSLLGSLMVEIMRRYRIITIEDTLELPTDQLTKLGFNLQSMKVASPLAGGKTSEVDASTGIRTTLRLGDSALIIGEIRSKEAVALYEAMRVGAAANVVAGTIHGASPYGIFDRVVNDIGVPKTSFKATDIIVVANPVRSAASLRKQRRVLSVTEVRKDWTEDPATEGGFVNLLKYNPTTDSLEVTNDLMNGNSDVLKEIAGGNKDFAGNWDAVWDNILLRGKVKKALVDIAEKTRNLELLEAEFYLKTNDAFHNISSKIRNEIGSLDSKRIFFEFNEWLKKEVKRAK